MLFKKALKTKKRIILASGSRIRKQLFEAANIEFEVINSNVDENPLKRKLFGRPINEQVTRLAFEKSLAVSKDHPDAYVIGSDNMCTLGEKFLINLSIMKML